MFEYDFHLQEYFFISRLQHIATKLNNFKLSYLFLFLSSPFFSLYIYIYVPILYNDKFPENNGQKWIVNYLQSGTKCETVRSMCHF